MHTIKPLENNFTEGQAKLKNVDLGSDANAFGADVDIFEMTDGHDIHHFPLMPRPLMCSSFLHAVSISLGRDEDTYRTGGRLTRLIEQERWRFAHEEGARKAGDGEGREFEEDGFKHEMQRLSLCCAQESWTH